MQEKHFHTFNPSLPGKFDWWPNTGLNVTMKNKIFGKTASAAQVVTVHFSDCRTETP
jgi:hypothetical protein